MDDARVFGASALDSVFSQFGAMHCVSEVVTECCKVSAEKMEHYEYLAKQHLTNMRSLQPESVAAPGTSAAETECL